MAESTETKKVYTFDTSKSTCPLIEEDYLPVGQALQSNQTTIKPNDGDNYWNGNTWVNSLVSVWCFDPSKNNEFTGITQIPQGSALKANQTFTKPEDGLYQPMKFNGATWIGTPKEEWEKAHPVEVPVAKPDKGVQAVNLLGKQIAKMQQQQATMAQSINALGQLVAKAQTPAAQQPTEPAQSGNQTTEPQA